MHAQIVLFDGFDPLDVIAPYEVLYAGGTASGGAVSVELVSAEGPREVVSGTGGLPLRATAALDPGRAGLILVPGASGRLGEPGEVPDHDAGAGGHQQDEFIPVLLGEAVTKPVRLNLACTVTLAGDTVTGTSKAGRFPAAKVAGQRRTIPAATEHRP